MKPVKALCFDLDETLLDSSGLQESIVQTCKVIAASKSGLEARDLVEANKKIWPDYFREAEHKWKLGHSTRICRPRKWRRTLRHVRTQRRVAR
jgi:FMN phosphatase YigB (HAD superfamily)